MKKSNPINLHLYPCLDFISKHGDRKDMAQIYDLITRGRGLSLIESCEFSTVLANEYGLLGGIPFTPDEILAYGSCFKDRMKGKIPCTMVQFITHAIQLDIYSECCKTCKQKEDFPLLSFEDFAKMNAPESSDDNLPYVLTKEALEKRAAMIEVERMTKARRALEQYEETLRKVSSRAQTEESE